MQWYYSESGRQSGPIPEDELRNKIASGAVKSEDLVWHDGMTDWQPVSRTPELATALVASAPPQFGPPPGGPPAASPYQSPTAASPANLGMPMGVEIPSYLWQSIVVTILCCWPLGIPAIVYAAKVDGLKRTGDWQAASVASNSAKTWCWVAFGLGIVSNLAVLGLMIAAES